MDQDKWTETRKLIAELKPEAFIKMVTLAIWAAQSCDEHNLEVAYVDNDVILFRRVHG